MRFASETIGTGNVDQNFINFSGETLIFAGARFGDLGRAPRSPRSHPERTPSFWSGDLEKRKSAFSLLVSGQMDRGHAAAFDIGEGDLS